MRRAPLQQRCRGSGRRRTTSCARRLRPARPGGRNGFPRRGGRTSGTAALGSVLCRGGRQQNRWLGPLAGARLRLRPGCLHRLPCSAAAASSSWVAQVCVRGAMAARTASRTWSLTAWSDAVLELATTCSRISFPSQRLLPLHQCQRRKQRQGDRQVSTKCCVRSYFFGESCELSFPGRRVFCGDSQRCVALCFLLEDTQKVRWANGAERRFLVEGH